jgi:hypothetical protein
MTPFGSEMANTRPDFLVNVADDLGFSDCGTTYKDREIAPLRGKSW